MYIKFSTFSKKGWPSELIYFRNYALRKTWLDICPRSPVSKDPLTGNMVNGFKHCCDLENSTVTIFSDHLEGN